MMSNSDDHIATEDVEDEDLSDPYFISGRPSITNGLELPGQEHSIPSSPSTYSRTPTRSDRRTLDPPDRPGLDHHAMPTQLGQSILVARRYPTDRDDTEGGSFQISSGTPGPRALRTPTSSDPARHSISSQYARGHQDRIDSRSDSGTPSCGPEVPREDKSLPPSQPLDIRFDLPQLDMEDPQDPSPFPSASLRRHSRSAECSTGFPEIVEYQASQNEDRSLSTNMTKSLSPPTNISDSRPKRKTVQAINERSEIRRLAQIKLLTNVNVHLGKLAKAWTGYVQSLGESTGRDGGGPGEFDDATWMAVSEQWSETAEHVNECNKKLEAEWIEIRDQKSSGTPWHNHNGIYYDLPLSWFNYQHRYLAPTRVQKMSPTARTSAQGVMKILQVLTDKAEAYHAHPRNHAVAVYTQFTKANGIPDMKWRGKLGSIDVVGFV